MKQDDDDCCREEQPQTKHRLFGCDPAPLIVLAVFVLLVMQFFPELRLWLLALIVIGIVIRVALRVFRSIG